MPGYIAEHPHRVIADKLEAVMRGDIKRLVIQMPPRHGKSELVSRRFPPFFLAHYPDKEIIAASYNATLANTFGRKTLELARSDEFGRLFPDFAPARDVSRQNEWMTTAGGSYVAAGVGNAITGRGAHVFLIDDPVKGREEAESETMREKAWEWYTSVARTRLAPGGAIVLCQTRWHEDDLAGRILEKSDGKWEVINFPALSEDGKALCPKRYDVEELHDIRSDLPLRDWQSLYQGNPSPEDGSYFKRDQFRPFDLADLPDDVRVFGASDYAITEGDGDYTVHVVGALDADDNLYILDVWRGQTEPDVWIEQFINMIRTHEPLRWGEESGQIIKSVGPFLSREMLSQRVYCDRRQYTSAADKPTRARTLQGRMSMGKVYFPRDALWMDWLQPEMLKFPMGKNDDGVDGLSLLARLAADIGPPRRKPVKKQKPRKRDAWAGV